MKLNVAVVFGGKSTEHEVSVISALQAIENLDTDKYNVIPIYMDKEGDFYASTEGILLDAKNYRDISKLLNECKNIEFVKIKNRTFIREVDKGFFGYKINIEIDVVFPIVHGTNVEDGNLQGFLHTLNLPIVGPDTLSAAISMDKFVMKEYVKAMGIPVIKAVRIDKNDFKNIDVTIEMLEKEIGYPMIVKPVNLGSSIGIKKAKDRDGLKDAMSLAFSFAYIVLVEKAIVNMREINCAVLGDKFDAMTSVLEEPFGSDEILSFADKYMSGGKGGKNKLSGTKFGGTKALGEKSGGNIGSKSGMASLKRKIPADIDETKAKEIKEYALKIFKYLGCSGVARIDFIIDKDENAVYANEINPIPGSLSFYLFEPMGIKYKELLDKLIDIAIKSFRDMDRLNFTFDNNLLR